MAPRFHYISLSKLVMDSVVDAALEQVVQDLKAYQLRTPEAQFETMQTAYSLLGRPFLESLTNIERSPQDLIVRETPTFISVAFKDHKELLFTNQQAPLGFECICEVAWDKKTGLAHDLMCKHEAAYLLWKYCFPQYSHYSTRLTDSHHDPNEVALGELLDRRAMEQ